MPPLYSLMFRLDDLNPGHARLSVWSGSSQAGDPDALHHARGGEIVLRADEWEALRALIDFETWPVQVLTPAPALTLLRLDWRDGRQGNPQ